MRRIDKLVIGAIVPPTIITLCVLTFVVFVRELGRLSELFITRNASLGVIASIAGAILPGILVFSLPLSFLIGCLIGLSGLSGESQVTALKACGVPLRRLMWPMACAASSIALLGGFFSVFVLPRTTAVFENVKYRINLRQVTSQIQPRVFNEDFPNVVFYLDDLAADRQYWSRVFVADNTDAGAPKIILAREGNWVTDESGSRLQLHLVDGRVYQIDPADETRDNVSQFVSTDIPMGWSASAPGAGETSARPARKPAEMGTLDLWRGNPDTAAEIRRAQLIELHRRLALPFSVFGFALMALSLGVSTRRTGRTTGFVMGLLLVVLFYTMFMNGLRLASVGKVPPWLGAWGANLILVALGVAMFMMAERGTQWGQRFYDRRWRTRIPLPLKKTQPPESRPLLCLNLGLFAAGGRITRRCLPKILDFYVSRGFLIYFSWSAVACGSLFVILTLFELLDDIIRNNISVIQVADYFFSLAPQILLLIVPMAVLLATLIHFGILEKSSEITAIKAGGWSLYRISVPVLVLSSAVCVGLYLLQDYVLPYANIRQDSLRNVIKGRPAQTLGPQRKWIFGEAGRIFNYDYFDTNQDRFVGLNVIEIDFNSLQILQRIHAARATIDRAGAWKLETGWVHDFRPGKSGFRRITSAEYRFPEHAAYFEKEIFDPKESSKLTYLELKNYISFLEKTGYNAAELQVELHKKISFPLSAVVMALLGIPFSFSMGKRGAFFGVGASIIIAMVYWGVFSIFEQMGAYGLLTPSLAAWAPDLVFGATGLSLLFTIRT